MEGDGANGHPPRVYALRSECAFTPGHARSRCPSLILFSLDGEHRSFLFGADSAEPYVVHCGHCLPRRWPCCHRFLPLRQSRVCSLLRASLGVRCLPFSGSGRIHRVLPLPASACLQHHAVVGCSFPSDAFFVLAELAVRVQHIWNLTPHGHSKGRPEGSVFPPCAGSLSLGRSATLSGSVVLRNATPSIFHQRHLGRVLRSSCNSGGRRLTSSRGEKPRTGRCSPFWPGDLRNDGGSVSAARADGREA